MSRRRLKVQNIITLTRDDILLGAVGPGFEILELWFSELRVVFVDR